MGQGIASSQFYLYGKQYFTKTGYEAAIKKYRNPTFLNEVDLNSMVYMVTGANSGIGFEMAKYLSSRQATVYMVCRNPERGQAAHKRIVDETKNDNVHLLLGDVSLRGDVERITEEFGQQEERLNGLICNAGALLAEKRLTSEGFETTFACHLLFGSYHLTKRLIPKLSAATDPRVVMVSSGGMYNTKVPRWSVLTAEEGVYNGTLAYAYAKRAQVLLAETWTVQYPNITFVSAHPGWTSTPGVDTALANEKSWLEPLRTPWQGAEGICWLTVTDTKEIEGGAFYLDRQPCRKHVGGAFFTDGSVTKNTDSEVDELIVHLERWSNIADEEERKAAFALETKTRIITSGKSLPDMQAIDTNVDIKRFMGTWFVLASIPTYFEKNCYNAKENYTLLDDGTIDVKFTFRAGAFDGPAKEIPQKAFVRADSKTKSEWEVQPFWPVKLPYLIIELAEDYSYTVIGFPNRDYVWIMARESSIPEPTYIDIIHKLRTKHFYDTSKVIRVPQSWPTTDE